MNLARPSDLVMLIDGGHKLFIFRLQPGGELQTHRGVLRHDDLIGLPWGAEVASHLGSRFFLVEPTLHDILLHLRRRSQIMFPKDIGYTLLRLSVGPGKRVLEAGSGSGALTAALAWSVGPQGRVYSYDRREDMQALARQNLERLGLEAQVRFQLRDITSGFDETDVDAAFLDLPDPHVYLPQVRAALRSGGCLGAILPTMNQVSDLLTGLEQNGFAFVEVCEILLRFYKTIPARMRPTDRMVAHTGYLIFARAMVPGVHPPAPDGDDSPEEGQA